MSNLTLAWNNCRRLVRELINRTDCQIKSMDGFVGLSAYFS